VLNRVSRVTEIVGSSPESIDRAIAAAIERANETLRRLEWFEITNVRGILQGGRIHEYQVTLRVAFRLESDHPEPALMDFAPGPDAG
jgi:flavin-binding protein dodecin